MKRQKKGPGKKNEVTLRKRKTPNTAKQKKKEHAKNKEEKIGINTENLWG